MTGEAVAAGLLVLCSNSSSVTATFSKKLPLSGPVSLLNWMALKVLLVPVPFFIFDGLWIHDFIGYGDLPAQNFPCSYLS